MSSSAFQTFLILDLLALLAAVFAALSCGLLGNFLVLRKQSLMGDAISHAVLPGLVGAFLITQSRSPGIMFVGAAASALVTVMLVELIKRLGKVEPGAAMGVVFSIMFALGVYLLENNAARSVDLDADCVLHGNLQNLFWTATPSNWSPLLDVQSIQGMPRAAIELLVFRDRFIAPVPYQIWTLFGTTIAVILFITVLFKELRIASFDAGISTVQGINAGVMHMVLMTFVAIAAVASFEAVGSILVIAMLIAPAATARLLTDRLVTQIIVSAVIALITAIGGYALASWFGVNAAGMMASISGALLVLVMVASPSHGIITKAQNQRRLGNLVAIEDVLGSLYRLWETDERTTRAGLLAATAGSAGADNSGRMGKAIDRAIASGLITLDGSELSLTKAGLSQGATVIRKHRLWEGYLVDQAGISPDHVHDTAEQLEHLIDPPPSVSPDAHTDPHGKPIPPK